MKRFNVDDLTAAHRSATAAKSKGKTKKQRRAPEIFSSQVPEPTQAEQTPLKGRSRQAESPPPPAAKAASDTYTPAPQESSPLKRRDPMPPAGSHHVSDAAPTTARRCDTNFVTVGKTAAGPKPSVAQQTRHAQAAPTQTEPAQAKPAVRLRQAPAYRPAQGSAQPADAVSSRQTTEPSARRVSFAQTMQNAKQREAQPEQQPSAEADISASSAASMAASNQPHVRPQRSISGPQIAAVRTPYSAKVDSLRKLVSRLLLSKRGKKLEPLAICSLAPGDGRSFMASNLAVLFAQAGKRTLLIDADFRHADQHNIFSIDAGPGLAELLMGQSDWDAIKPIDTVANLFLLPFGRHPGDPLELLASDVFAEVFAKLADICDVVLVDTPSGLEHVDAQAIAGQIGSALLVVKQGGTQLGQAREFRESLHKAGVNVVGAVINQA